MKNGRFTLVDGLRGIAASSVVLFHCVEGHHVDHLLDALPAVVRQTVECGYLGVWIFFALSGFVIAHSLYGKSLSVSDFGRFILKRSLRLDIPYWTTIALTIAYTIASAHIVKDKGPSGFSAGQIIAHVFYLQDLLHFQPISAVFWTLCLEIQFYLIYAVIIRAGITGITIACVVSLLAPLGLMPSLPHGVFLKFWYAFLVGVAAYWAWRRNDLRYKFAGFVTILVIIAIMRGNPTILVSAMTATLLCAAGILGNIYSAMNWRWLQFMGGISYSLYLTHNMAIGLTFRILSLIIKSHTALVELAFLVMALAATIGGAFVFWWLVERPSSNLSKKITLIPSRI
ncbi:acyltransferase family protein [Komagataeibacter swingsii]|nr:acyltransferase [Komagataeibacter swingsii]